MTKTMLDQQESDRAAIGRFFDDFNQGPGSLEESYAFSEAFYSEHSALFKKIGSVSLVRAALQDTGQLASIDEYPDNPWIQVIMDARRRRIEQSFTWELSRFDPGAGMLIVQAELSPENLSVTRFILNKKHNLVISRRYDPGLALKAMTEVGDTVLDPITQTQIAETHGRISSPKFPNIGDRTDQFPYVPESLATILRLQK